MSDILLSLTPQFRCSTKASENAHVRPGFSANLFEARSRLEGKACGIPHLAKNERDVGHPAIVAGIEPKSALSMRAGLESEALATHSCH
jgi:hypothetical protein